MNALPHHPFRFGIMSLPAWDDLITQVRHAEELGYSAFHVGDHMFSIAPITALTAAAMATTRIRVGCMVMGNDFWNPSILAREALVIDNLSNGRLEFGLGSGWLNYDYQMTGIPMDTPGVRISRLEESVTIMKSLLAGEEITFQGKYYNISELNLATKPLQKPHIPLTIGGGSKRVLSLAARQADIISFNLRTTVEGWVDIAKTTLADTEQKVEWVRKAAGARLSELELSVFTYGIASTDSWEDALEQLESEYKNWGGITKAQMAESPHFLVGDKEQIIEKLYQNRERFGFSYYVIDVKHMESFAPLVQRLTGK
jgi:probable F420-dependent oxidoreductase